MAIVCKRLLQAVLVFKLFLARVVSGCVALHAFVGQRHVGGLAEGVFATATIVIYVVHGDDLMLRACRQSREKIMR